MMIAGSSARTASRRAASAPPATPSPAATISDHASAPSGRSSPNTTSLSTFGGVLPTAYGFGGYDAVMSPMSLALGWGLALTSGVTLFLVPALYVSANDINRQIDVWRRGRRPELGVADATGIGGDGPEEAAA